jgi:hypothetical protein
VESADIEFETRSLPNLLVATLATLPSMSLIPSAPFADMFLRLPHFLDHRQA